MCAQLPRTRATDPQNLYKIHISEDCLYLNVFAPPQFTNDTYPVIVWIHGGQFQSGSASDYPQDAILNNFVSRKVIFVSVNYRLGPMGKLYILQYLLCIIVTISLVLDTTMIYNYHDILQ